MPFGSDVLTIVIARLDRAIQSSEESVINRWLLGLRDTPPEPVIGLAESETRWRVMTTRNGATAAE
jgi:hypothetical protein